jgi:cytidine deaminase
LKEEELIKTANQVREKAYCPYSKFRVGAALICENGEVFTGCNIENSSLGLSICAERVAVFNAVSSGNMNFKSIAIVTDADDITYPCGACLQVLREFSDDIKVILSSKKGEIVEKQINELTVQNIKF